MKQLNAEKKLVETFHVMLGCQKFLEWREYCISVLTCEKDDGFKSSWWYHVENPGSGPSQYD